MTLCEKYKWRIVVTEGTVSCKIHEGVVVNQKRPVSSFPAIMCRVPSVTIPHFVHFD